MRYPSTVQTIKGVVSAFYVAMAVVDSFKAKMGTLGEGLSAFFTGQWSSIAKINEDGAEKLRKIDEQLAADRKQIWARFSEDVAGAGVVDTTKPKKDDLNITDAGAAEKARAEAQALHNAELEKYVALLKQLA